MKIASVADVKADFRPYLRASEQGPVHRHPKRQARRSSRGGW